MGLDLTLVIIDNPHDWWWLGYNRLQLARDYGLFSQIRDIGRGYDQKPVMNPWPLPEKVKFDWYGDEGITQESTDPYGEPLTYVRAGDFEKIKLKDINERNYPIVKFMRKLPPDTPIVLYWS